MRSVNRRAFLSDVGRGMLAVGLGAGLSEDLGVSTAFAEQGPEAIALGDEYASLVALMRETPAEALQPKLVAMLRDGKVDLTRLTSAAALANAITFGGSDYVGYHTAMAMLPALEMSRMLDKQRAALPVLKVLYRNSQQIQSVGGLSHTALLAHHLESHAPTEDLGVAIRDACRKPDVALGEDLLAGASSTDEAFNALQLAIQDDMNVHRFVLAYRTYGLANLLGEDYSHAILRQCVRFCADQEQGRITRNQPESPIRRLMPQLLDQHHLAGAKFGRRDPGDEAVLRLAETVYVGPRDQAAGAVAEALAEGIDPECVGEAISLASNMYVLRQGEEKWRTHGDSAGVHSSDATNAWRNMARVARPDHAMTGLIVAAYHAGVQSAPFETPDYPTAEHRALVQTRDPKELLAVAEEAIRRNDQGRASAAIAFLGELNPAKQDQIVDGVLGTMLKYAISEDGRLHGEKYFQTVREEYAATRPAYRWRQIVALARVTASSYGYNRADEHGHRAAGYEEACQLLGVTA